MSSGTSKSKTQVTLGMFQNPSPEGCIQNFLDKGSNGRKGVPEFKICK